jgi:hypothetical protein
LAIYESTFFRVLSDALAKGDYALAMTCPQFPFR